jgi:DNA replication protein DnaC
MKFTQLREEYIDIEKAIEARKWSADEWNYRTLIGQGCSPRTIDAIRRELDERSCMKKTRDWMRDGTQWSLLLSGRPGCGKTTAAAWAAHQLTMRKFSPRWVRCVSMVDQPMWGFEAQLAKAKCQDAGILVLDDIGAGAREADAKPWLGWLDDVLDMRHGRRRKTIITSNLPLKKLKEWLGPRLVDRLREGAEHETAEPSMRGSSHEGKATT